MRAIIVLMASVLSMPASAQAVMYVRPPRAVLCDRLDYARLAVQAAAEAMRSGRAARFPDGCWIVQPDLPVTMLDQFDDYAYVGVEVGPGQPASRAWVHVGALSPTPGQAHPRRPR